MSIKSSGPTIDADVPWNIRQHLQLFYQKLGNHTQAFALQQQAIANLKSGSTTTNIIENSGASPTPPPSTGFIGQGLINNQTGATSYITQPGDNGILLIINDASPVAVTLTTAAAPFYLIITNFGAGVATLSPSTGTINGGSSLSLLQNQTVLASCDSTNWLTTAFQLTIANVSGLAAALASLAPIASPTFTGTVTQPTPDVLTAATTATSAAAGAATALPATPLGYLQMSVNGTIVKLPFFAV